MPLCNKSSNLSGSHSRSVPQGAHKELLLFVVPGNDKCEGMQIDNQDSSRTETRSPDLVQDRSPPRKITVEDSMDVLSELINEIQASNDLKLDIQPQPKPNQEQPSSPSSHSSIRSSLLANEQIFSHLFRNVSMSF
jgi:hypothetical protein